MRPSVAVCALLLMAGCGNAAVQQADLGHGTGHDTAQARQAARRVVAPSPSKSAAAPRPAASAIPAVQRVIIAGDSIPEDLGPMVTAAMAGPRFTGHTESHPSTGLVRNDFFDWTAAARRIAAERPTTVILLMGGNDNQPIKPPNGPYADPASLRWTAEYARRAGLVMDALRDGGVPRVYWLTMPTTTRSGMNVAVTAMGQALHQAARGRSGVTVYDTDQLLAPIAGTAAAHQADGIHLSIQGSQKIAYVLIQRLRADATGE